MAQEMKEQKDVQTNKIALVGKITTNYDKVKKSYKKILKKSFDTHEKLNISEIYNRVLSDLKWDEQRRPSVRQLINRYKKEISNDQKNKQEKK